MDKEKVEVVIMGKIYTIIGASDKDYLQKLASYIDSKLKEIVAHPSFKRMSLEHKQLFIHLNLAEDYFNTKEWVEKLEADKKNSQAEIDKLNKKIVELEMRNAKLSGRLEEIDKINKNGRKN